MATKQNNGVANGAARDNLQSRPRSGSSKKRRFQSALMQKAVDNQLPISLSLLGALGLLSVMGAPHAESFHTLSYRRPPDYLYEKGRLDACYVAAWFLLFTLLRAFLMDYVLRPLGAYWGISREGKLSRFSEQGWNVAYYVFSWTMGIYVMSGKPYDFFEQYRSIPPEQQRSIGTAGFWMGYPHRAISSLDKWYYLMQLAFWLQQLFVINTEKRRKDYYQMLTHHIVTCMLIISSYVANFTYIGNAVLVLMDFSDIILSFAKMLRYIGFSLICDILFGIFVVSWIYTRHYLYFFLVRSILSEGPQLAPFKYDPINGYFWTFWVHKFFLASFAALQVLLLIWLAMIFKVIAKVVSGNNADDSRSDSDLSDSEDGQALQKKST